MLAAKAALAIRVDALGEDNNTEIGINNRAKIESRLRTLEEGYVSDMTVAFLVLLITVRLYGRLI